MRRQLYKGGGITSLYPRKKFGIGSWFQETKDKIVSLNTNISTAVNAPIPLNK